MPNMPDDESEMTVAELQQVVKANAAEVDALHACFERDGVNSRGISDIFGRRFSVPVDAEHKATALPILNCSNPHMRAFHASWFGFFTTFFSTFAAAPLMPFIKKDHPNMPGGLSKDDIYAGNISSVAGTILARLIMGTVCDVMGARKGLAFVLFITCPFIIGMMFINNASGFIACRLFIGCGLASFVACQVWCTQQFSKKIVGLANATAGGWGNLGGGITNLLMVFIFLGFMAASDDEDRSWRLCFLVPLALHIAGGVFCLTGRDLPDGTFKELESSGATQKSNPGIVLKVGASNINAWILTVTYGFCFGVELTMTNVASLYFYEYHGMTPLLSSIFASIFGLVNIVARSLGGMWSDWSSMKFGMRGRIWSLWFWQSVEGVLCVVMALVTIDYRAPDDLSPKINGWAQVDFKTFDGVSIGITTGGNWTELVPPETAAGEAAFRGVNYQIVSCGANALKLTNAMKAALGGVWAEIPNDSIVLTEAPSPFAGGDDCISNSGTVGLVVFIMFLFSVAVQMAEGLTFGVVPYVSRPALGVVSGMVGAGGNLGAVIATSLFFKGSAMRTDDGILYLGITILALTMSCFGLYFPESGGMLFKAGAIKYDPQLIKPPSGYRGADSMDLANANVDVEKAKQVDKANVVTAQA